MRASLTVPACVCECSVALFGRFTGVLVGSVQVEAEAEACRQFVYRLLYLDILWVTSGRALHYGNPYAYFRRACPTAYGKS